MTRINCIPVRELTDKHLIAEYRELPRVFKLARKCEDAPKEYTLGKGHVKFFYNKLTYLFFRQHQLVDEMVSRGFKPKFDPDELARTYHTKENAILWNDWYPTKEAIAINKERITQRLKGK